MKETYRKAPTNPAFSLPILLVGFIFLQGCGEESQFVNNIDNQFQRVCVEEEGHKAYVVNKNSVYQKKEISSLIGPDYSGLSLQPVNLLFLDGFGQLRNDTFRILSYKGPQVQTTKCSLKFDYESDQGATLSQVTSYYYSSLARQFSKDKELSLIGQGVYIITQSSVTGWSSKDNTIYLGVHTETQHDSGLDGSIILSLISEANIYYASEGAIYKRTNQNHRDCREEKEMCCLSEEGCSKALTIGLSHYFSSYFFRTAPTIGEAYSNSLTGIEDCGISRDLNQSKDLSLTEAFSACEEDSHHGYVYPMATVYASIWWNVFNKIMNTEPQEVNRFQVFYLEHLKRLKGNFNFIDAFHSMSDLDSKEFESKFTHYFRDEFIRRGINL